MRRRVGQGNLVEGLIPARVGANPMLERIAALLDGASLEAVLSEV